MYCKNCGHETDGKFCSECGVKLEIEEKSYFLCPVCQSIISDTSFFCNNCGLQIRDLPQPTNQVQQSSI